MKSLLTIAALSLLGAALFVGCGDDAESSSGGTGASGSGGAGGAGGGSSNAAVHLTQAELERVTRFLASDEMNGRDEGTPENAAARAFIIEELQKCGVEPAGIAGESGFEQPIATGVGTNILGKVTGADPNLASRHIIVSAHYDHIGACGGQICNGANDNAAGVAIAIGVACAVAQEPLPRTVLFAGWDAEEPPTFQTDAMGSEYYGANPVVPLEQTDVAIVMDLVGGNMWAGWQGHILLGAESSLEVAAAIDGTPIPEGLLAYRAGVHLAEETALGHVPWSDHDAFRNRDVPFLFLSNGQDKRYHETDDEADLLDYPKMAKQAQYLFDIVGALGNAQVNPVFISGGTDHPRDAQSVRILLEEALAPGGLVDALSLSAQSRSTLEADLENARSIEAVTAGGAPIGADDVQLLRNGAQHIMCFAGSSYSESTCNQF